MKNYQTPELIEVKVELDDIIASSLNENQAGDDEGSWGNGGAFGDLFK